MTVGLERTQESVVRPVLQRVAQGRTVRTGRFGWAAGGALCCPTKLSCGWPACAYYTGGDLVTCFDSYVKSARCHCCRSWSRCGQGAKGTLGAYRLTAAAPLH